jgi:hypothetical protein
MESIPGPHKHLKVRAQGKKIALSGASAGYWKKFGRYLEATVP